MALTRRLEMQFTNAAGRRVTVAVVEPRDNVTADEVRTAMQTILGRNVFTTSGGDLTAIAGARIVARDVSELNVG